MVSKSVRVAGTRLVTPTVLMLVFLLTFELTATTFAVPGVTAEFQLTIEPLQWFLNGYTLAICGGTLLGGAIADARGVRGVMAVGVLRRPTTVR